MSHPRYAMVMISIGSRPWVQYTSRCAASYCRRHGYDFFLVADKEEFLELRLKDLPEDEGRRNKDVYAARTYLAWKYMKLKGYDKVGVIDDGCTITPLCPPLFEMVPPGRLGGPRGRESEARQCFEYIHSKEGLEPFEKYRPDWYVTTRLAIYDQQLLDVIAPERLYDASELLASRLPHSTLTYYLFGSRGVEPFFFPEGIHSLPGWTLPAPARKSMRNPFAFDLSAASLWAVTSGYWNRSVMASGIAVRANYLWDLHFNGRVGATWRFLIDMTRVIGVDRLRSVRPSSLSKKIGRTLRRLRR